MATASNFSLDFADHGVSTTIPDDDIARLMYYLHSVTVGVGIDILPDDLIRYKHYYELTPDRIALVLQFAIELNPEEYVGKLLFRDDEHEVIEYGSTNKFVTISAACNVVSLSRDVVVAGQVQNITKVMFFTTAWLDTYYIKPAQRIGRLLMGTAHCSHCEGKAGICKCSSCDRPDESECTPFANLLMDAFALPAPTPPPEPEINLQPDQHYATCDGCTWGGFNGARFKCGECDDYDLCEPCYRRNVHDMWHAFIRIDTPGATPIALISRAEAAQIQAQPTPPAPPRLPPALPPRRVPTPPPIVPRIPPSLPPRRVPTPPRVAPVPPPPPPPPVVIAPPAVAVPPPPPYDASGGDGRDDPAPSQPSSGAFFYETMTTTDLHGFLKTRGVAHDDISEKDQEGLCKRVWETHCDCMSIAELNGFLAEQNISTADCRDINSRRQKAKDAFRPPPPPPPPAQVVVQAPASSKTQEAEGTGRFKKDDEVILKGLTRVDMNGKTAVVLSVDHGAGKVQIRVHDLEKTFKVKPENLSLAADLELEEEDEELE